MNPQRQRIHRFLPTLTRRRRWTAASLVVALLVAGLAWQLGGDDTTFRTQEQQLRVLSGPGRDEPVNLDTTLYLPEGADSENPVPAVLLAHGFGGTKRSVADEAQRLASDGYAVMTWSARGFGTSGGSVHLNSPDYEVNDARGLIDVLAARDDIVLDDSASNDSGDDSAADTENPATRDPRVAVAGASYGGGLALLLAGYDQRVDAIVPQITWNDLSRSFFPNTAAEPDDTAQRGVFKSAWAGALFGNNVLRSPVNAASDNGTGTDATCGRLAQEVCRLYLESATTGQASPSTIALLQQSSPASVIDRISAPTLLLQGTQDTLFSLTEADANARGIAASGTPVKLAWFAGGHDAPPPSGGELTRLRDLTDDWLGQYLKGNGKAPDTSFSYSQASGINVAQPGVTTTSYTARRYEGLDGAGVPRQVELEGPAQQVANPPSGTPAALSSLPGVGALLTAVDSLGGGAGISDTITGTSREVNGQHARFQSAPLKRATTVVGAPQVRLRVSSDTGTAVLFAKLYDVGSGGAARLIGNAAAPLRLADLPDDETQTQTPAVTVTLPAMAHTFDAGHRLRLVVATADQAFRGPAEPAEYRIALAKPETGNPSISLPSVPATAAATESSWPTVLAVVAAVVIVGVVVALLVSWWRRRRGERIVMEGVEGIAATELAQTPLVVRNLSKTYSDGFVAVRDVSLRVEAGQVVGLLGPNGAGKTTTLRMLLGLIAPTSGEAYLFGHRTGPGAPVLAEVGALVEGPGFLPHLSGRENLELYWRATGRPVHDSDIEAVLEIAALGEAIDRKARTYSHGMKQRLAIAQAMLGMPRLLMLDEPTDGLDPPQIAAMRQVLQRYATDGRAVLVSSHLLAEVEQTCSHVVVVHNGRSIAAGPVADVIGTSPSALFEVSEPERATRLLRDMPGVIDVESADTTGTDATSTEGSGGLVVSLERARSEVVAELVAAGIAVERVVPRRRLEDAFLALVAAGDSVPDDRSSA